MVENYLHAKPDEYVKFFNNLSYVNLTAYSNTVQAFAHWTHHVTGGYLLVTDLQGVRDADADVVWLTDPAIHCTDTTRFGGTNFGADGIAAFFASQHSCNPLCRMLGLHRPAGMSACAAPRPVGEAMHTEISRGGRR